ncbi:hypothetical protein HOP38_16135 [Vibrio mediterranei]|uniref:hypothetical protein n=1 Tax=Vibrio mediterranei TaxID=689 RepID=UPI0017AE222D|nr:hypothetical protein [Vibrio mediterranei]NUW74021.1 hypothetical protein [Vibrio mediterranei]
MKAETTALLFAAIAVSTSASANQFTQSDLDKMNRAFSSMSGNRVDEHTVLANILATMYDDAVLVKYNFIVDNPEFSVADFKTEPEFIDYFNSHAKYQCNGFKENLLTAENINHLHISYKYVDTNYDHYAFDYHCK